jgi:hypothetical protein
MARNKYLDRAGFRQFLASRSGDLAFTIRTANACPVASYLEEQTRREWHVSALACVPQVDAEVGEHEFRPPRWARDFIHHFDSYFGTKPRAVTGEEALYVLNEVVR